MVSFTTFCDSIIFARRLSVRNIDVRCQSDFFKMFKANPVLGQKKTLEERPAQQRPSPGIGNTFRLECHLAWRVKGVSA